MTPDELRAIMAYLRDNVQLDSSDSGDPFHITFTAPTEDEMVHAGLNAQGVNRILTSSWWKDMVTDIIETPDFCEPEDTPEQVLEYAKDVVSDYLRKRVDLG